MSVEGDVATLVVTLIRVSPVVSLAAFLCTVSCLRDTSCRALATAPYFLLPQLPESWPGRQDEGETTLPYDCSCLPTLALKPTLSGWSCRSTCLSLKLIHGRLSTSGLDTLMLRMTLNAYLAPTCRTVVILELIHAHGHQQLCSDDSRWPGLHVLWPY